MKQIATKEHKDRKEIDFRQPVSIILRKIHDIHIFGSECAA
jgi:hypothetical protein